MHVNVNSLYLYVIGHWFRWYLYCEHRFWAGL